MKNFVLTPKLLHKDSEKDILLCHPRPALPLQIEKSLAGEWQQAGLDNLLALYEVDEQNSALLRLALPNGKQELSSAFVKTFPLDLAWEPYRAVPYQVITTEFSSEQLKSVYAEINETNYPIIKAFRSTSYEMVNQADHYYFYQKDHEHVPGMMLIEAQRQAVYAHVYTMTQHVRGEVTISLDKVRCEFYGYVDLMYPLELVVDDMQSDRNLRVKKNTYRVAFFQQGKLMAIIDSMVDVIEINQFNRFRNLFMYEKNQHCYSPIHTNRATLKLLDVENKEYPVECISISRERCITNDDNLALDNIRTIKVSASGFTFLSPVELESYAGKKVVWRLPCLTQEQLMNLGAIIKRGFKLQTNEVYS
jgi:hypothetical protein